jgi:hypothetical protein
MTILNKIKASDDYDELRKKTVKKAVYLQKNDEPCEDKIVEGAFIRGIVREVIMEHYPKMIDLLPKDENKLSDAIYLMGQDVEKALWMRDLLYNIKRTIRENALFR